MAPEHIDSVRPAPVMRVFGSDADIITRINTFLIRGVFWAVLLVGLADMAISFLRVEGLLNHFFSDDTIKALGRSKWRGLYIHWPLICAGMVLAMFTRTLGFHWLALLIVIAELVIVFSRFVFSLTPCSTKAMFASTFCTPTYPYPPVVRSMRLALCC